MKTIMRTALISAILAGIFVWPAAPDLLAGTSETLSQCRQLYSEGKFAEAIDKLTALAEAQDLSGNDAKEAYLLLAKASAGKNFMDQAELYLKKVLEIDCDFELNLKVEPPQLQRAWFKAEEQRDTICPVRERPDPGIKTLAVLYFENNSIVDKKKLDPLSKGLAAMLVTDLARISGLQVVERERVQYILDEIKMEQSDYFDQKSAVRVGKMLGAHTLLMGGFTKLDKKTMRIDARLIKTETGELLKADKVVGNPKKLGELEGELAIKIASNLNLAVGKNEKKAIQADKGQPIKAILAYTRGLNLEDEQQLGKAYKAYKEALAAYPNMDEAKDRIQALEPLISAGG